MPESTYDAPIFGRSVQRTRGLRNAWLLNVWRMRRHTEDGLTIDYFVRKGTMVVTRIRIALDDER